ncbi:MAG: hypothetical protein ABIA47_00905 [bacterium]
MSMEHEEQEYIESEKFKFDRFLDDELSYVLPYEEIGKMGPEQKLNALLSMVNSDKEAVEEGAERPAPSQETFNRWLYKVTGDEALFGSIREENPSFESYKYFLAQQAPPRALAIYLQKRGYDSDVAPEDAKSIEDFDLEEVDIKDLEQYFQSKSTSGKKMPRRYIGFHTAPIDIPSGQIKQSAAVESRASKLEEVREEEEGDRILSGWTWYSLDTQHLYPEGNWLYLVEVNAEGDVRRARENRATSRYHFIPEHNWVGVTRPLKIISRVPINGETRKNLGLRDAPGSKKM